MYLTIVWVMLDFSPGTQGKPSLGTDFFDPLPESGGNTRLTILSLGKAYLDPQLHL